MGAMSQEQRLTMLDLSSRSLGGLPGELCDLGLGCMLEAYLSPVVEGSRRYYLKSVPHRQIIQV